MPPVPGVGKRFSLTIETKMKIYAELDKKRPRTEIAKEFNLAKSSLHTIIKNRSKIVAASKSGLTHERVRTTEAKYPRMEKALVDWLTAMRNKNVPVDGNFLKSKAETFALRMDIQDFKCSDGWLQKFKLRHGLSFRKLCGESASVDPKTVSDWKGGRLQRLLSDYDPKDIFNADETGLFFKLLPDRSLVFKGDSCNGGKRAKQRITVMLACNMTGTEKLPLFVIGKAQKPRCFKGIRSLPTKYAANSKSWMTAVLFEEWVREIDRKFAAQGRKILLIVDNCTAHGEITGLKAVSVEFLPPNVTSVMQPLDQGVIQCWKKHYRRMLLSRIILNLELGKDYEIQVLAAIHLSVAAWDAVTEQTIANCFRHAGFKVIFPSTAASDCDQQPETSADVEEDEQLLARLRDHVDLPDSLNFEEYARIDEDVQCAEEPTEEEIIQKILANSESENKNDESSSEEDDHDVPHPPKPSCKEAAEAVTTLRQFFEGEEYSENELKLLTKMENRVYKLCMSRKKQLSITRFLDRVV